MKRHDAEMKLKSVFGFDSFYDNQWKTIEQLFNGRRVLLIEKTGFGKSLCFQFPATQLPGVTIVFSPLIALMRDQIKSLDRLGIAAGIINSEQTVEENKQVLSDAIEGRLKILYIAPERQENMEWMEASRRILISMIVVDEAHTISVWGHDFRPAFQRIVDIVNLQPENMPVLAITATATRRVQKDIEKQIRGNLLTIRGNLLRDNLHLFVIKTSSEEEKYIWLAENLKNMPGTGIIYTGTRQNTKLYSKWLNYCGISAKEYSAGLDAENRIEVETGFMKNRWKTVVATNALGMGIDKPDIRFIIHTQIPASPVHYYQEIGRAGRDGKQAFIILFYNCSKDSNGTEEDYKLPKSFIDNARPSIDKYNRVLKVIKNDILGERDIIKICNLKAGEVRTIKADLVNQKIINMVIIDRKKKYEYRYNAPELNTKEFGQLRNTKLKELDSMLDYVNTTQPRFKFLCEYLGDSIDENYIFKNCDNSRHGVRKVEENPELLEKLKTFREQDYPELPCGKINKEDIIGYAASYYGVSRVGEAIHRCKYENGGDFPDFLLNKVIAMIEYKYQELKPDIILYVPSTISGNLVQNFARKIAKHFNIQLSHELKKIKNSKTQREFRNSALKKENVNGAFYLSNELAVQSRNIILIDDIYDSGATIKEIVKLLYSCGAKNVAPVCIAKTSGGDIL